LALEGLPLVDAVNDGLNASAPQPSAWKPLDTVARAPVVELSVDSADSNPQFVGFSSKPWRLTVTARDFMRTVCLCGSWAAGW